MLWETMWVRRDRGEGRGRERGGCGCSGRRLIEVQLLLLLLLLAIVLFVKCAFFGEVHRLLWELVRAQSLDGEVQVRVCGRVGSDVCARVCRGRYRAERLHGTATW